MFFPYRWWNIWIWPIWQLPPRIKIDKAYPLDLNALWHLVFPRTALRYMIYLHHSTRLLSFHLLCLFLISTFGTLQLLFLENYLLTLKSDRLLSILGTLLWWCALRFLAHRGLWQIWVLSNIWNHVQDTCHTRLDYQVSNLWRRCLPDQIIFLWLRFSSFWRKAIQPPLDSLRFPYGYDS